ncbi:chemotaxis protein [Vibrio tapetis subsp. quintayensis]|uniref:chemotaxis protein n=1 Tax=Vibrio tapetis TaxID=52443 RepID=UPI0025B44E6D|nr:chemotaxis protein [Vibrio tapetis]MDN3679226.1 chemotaxis protein [Vibrio tapetis subsp. quintayensis]
MSDKRVFVTAAEVAAELNKGMVIAKRLLLIASNARALALRAGESAAGFRPITDSIDDLVRTTLDSSKIINGKAQRLSRIATAENRSALALSKYHVVYSKYSDADHISSIGPAYEKTRKKHMLLITEFRKEAKALNDLLQELYSELRTAQIISTMLSVEASQAGELYQDQLNSIASSVSESANAIQKHVSQSLKLFSELTKAVYAIKSTL